MLYVGLFAGFLLFLFPKVAQASCFDYQEGVTPCYTASGDDFLCTSPQGNTQCCTESKYECNPEVYCLSSGGACVPTNFLCQKEYSNKLDCREVGLKCGSSCKAPTFSSGSCQCTNVGAIDDKFDFCDKTTSRATCQITNGSVTGCQCAPINQNSNSDSGREKLLSDYRCPGDDKGIMTAIGCLHVLGDEATALNTIIAWAMGVGGGIAFLLMLYAGFMLMTAAGNPERMKAGQELMTSAIAGLILLVFSVFILKFIGVDILGLCKFGFGTNCTQ